jgi:hypothetical protein
MRAVGLVSRHAQPEAVIAAKNLATATMPRGGENHA